eukprot:TRINITY_DN7858_c0_g1_i1.p1 TRINITY_DN7858_c0_g1~~TRINITY_DN7858_c0_g1_i1.p1  ORF type:complete len:532 (-),score=115.22 TRINITY_DN7858_c0_g1_i1:15-1610(-)
MESLSHEDMKDTADEDESKVVDGKEEVESDSEPNEGIQENDVFVDPSSLSAFAGDSLPYSLTDLSWDRNHYKNSENKYCYCGKPRTKYNPMYKCKLCDQWFHLECLKQKPSHCPLAGDSGYDFHCCLCSGEGVETLTLQNKPWTDIVKVAIWNLVLNERKKGSSKRYFQYKDELCGFINKHWNVLCFGKTRTKTWENTIGSSLSTKPHLFESGAEQMGSAGYWGLRHEVDPYLMKDSASGSSTKSSKASGPKVVGKKKNPKKKRLASDAFGSEEKAMKVRKPKPIPAPSFYPKVVYDPRRFGYTEQILVKENSAPQAKIQDHFIAINESGYRTVRSSIGVTEGSWYFEVEILPHGGHTRLGWSTEKGDVQAPVGYDVYGYSYRDKAGDRFHVSRGTTYGKPYGPGAIIGFHINLPRAKDGDVPESKVVPGSSITFYLNGESQGVAFTDINDGTYYAAASLYMGGTVKFNFGPNFTYAPKEIQFNPLSAAQPPTEPLSDPNQPPESTPASPGSASPPAPSTENSTAEADTKT